MLWFILEIRNQNISPTTFKYERWLPYRKLNIFMPVISTERSTSRLIHLITFEISVEIGLWCATISHCKQWAISHKGEKQVKQLSLHVTGKMWLPQKIRFPKEETTCKAMRSHEELNFVRGASWCFHFPGVPGVLKLYRDKVFMF